MKYAFLVAWREYAENAKTKGFWMGIFVMPIILFLSIQAPIWLEQKATPIRYFVLVDQSRSLGQVIESRLESVHQQRVLEALNQYARKYSQPGGAGALLGEFADSNPRVVATFMAKGGERYYLSQLRPRLKPDAPPFQEPRRPFQRVALPPGLSGETPLNELAQELKPYFRGDKLVGGASGPVPLSAAILIPPKVEDLIVRPGARGEDEPARSNRRQIGVDQQIQYWSVNASDSRLHDEIEQAIIAEIRQREYQAHGLDAAAVRDIERTFVLFASLNPRKAAGQETVGAVDTIKQWLPSGFVYLLWLSIFVIIQMLLNNTIEEKSNRIIEVLLSSVTPGELMMGKLFGIAAIGLTMVGAWMASLFGILSWKAGGASELAGQLLTVLKASNLVPLFSLYFLLGYLMYAAFILSIGSVCNTIKEAQSYMSLLTVIMIVPLLTMTFIPKDPNGPVARLLSWIPLYTPFAMMNRAAAEPPLFDLVGTLVLLLGVTALALWMSGKIFRIGILRTGQPPKIIEMLRWAMRRE
jgi:ABC-2 type transport system permease protein